ncbi:hypothetical protein [Leptolyngbya ohadii]|uniref:hypothetical protein n=1 Tax=Leptolyngbya ohadii TaxID=1962290 RepID=UPI000B59B84C|nr:hypothetical protein [Leptolyngbya ohadii]
MDTSKRGRTSEMQVTSIRLEFELKERLRQMSGEQGYQTLIRKILWQFVEQQTIPNEGHWRCLSQGESFAAENRQVPSHPPLLSKSDIRATIAATAQQEERCAMTGQLIRSQQPMWLGWTTTGEIVPLSIDIAG